MKTRNILAFALATAVAGASAISCGTKATNHQLKEAAEVFTAEEMKEIKAEAPTAADLDSVCYILGVNLGQMIKLQYNIATEMNELNMDKINEGLKDAMKLGRDYEEWDKILKVKTDRVGEVMNSFIGKRMDLQSKIDLKKEENWLAENKTKEGIQVTESGLQYNLIEAGEGEKITAADTVIVNYKGTLVDGTEFDANDSTEFPVNRVIPGWTEGLQLLAKGGKAMFYIPSELAYGPRGSQSIAPNSTLIFEVEVVDVKKAKEENK